MLVTGTVDVAPDGSVSSVTLDHPELLPWDVRTTIEHAQGRWRFEQDPSPGAATRHATMALRVVRRSQNGVLRNHLVAASFSDGAVSQTVVPKMKTAIDYPIFAARYRVAADVYMLMRVDKDGRVTDAGVSQVNLDSAANESVMRQVRKLFADAGVKGVKGWTFDVKAPGNQADGAWLVRMPIRFRVIATASDKQDYGKWSIYVPGPAEHISWMDKYGYAQPSATSNDALPQGSLQLLNQQIALVTPLDE
jgi:hypothetical protein